MRRLTPAGDTRRREYSVLVQARTLRNGDFAGQPLGAPVTEYARYRRLRMRTSAALAEAIGGWDPLIDDRPVVEAIRASTRELSMLDRSTIEHQWRTAELAGGIGARMGLNVRQLRLLATAAALHDVGKLLIPAHLLHRPGPLTAEEYDLIRDHSAYGEEWLASAGVTEPIPSIVRAHHERWDGRGYPDGLSGERIPIEARVLCVADALDAMASQRPYHSGRTMDEVHSILKSESGRAFDPAAVEAIFSFWT